MNAKVRLSSRVAAVLVLLFLIAAWPGRPAVLRGSQAVQTTELDRALRASDLDKARRLVPESWAAAEQLFVSYLERAFVSPDAARGRPDARALAGRLAEVFFRIVEYDFARAVVSTLDAADPPKRQQLLAVVRDCFSTLERLRASYAPSESRTSVQTVIRTQLSEIADRFRALSFLRGELFALKSAVNLGGLEPRAAQVADELGDDLSRVRKTPYTEASLAMARRLGLPRLQASILAYLGGTASRPDATTDSLEQAAKYYEQAQALARTLPALEELNAWHYRVTAPQAATIYHPRLWTVYHRLQRPSLAQPLVAEAVEISRPFGETAVLATLSQFARDAVGFGSDAVEAVLQASLAYSAKAELATMRTLSRSGSTFRLDLAEKALALAVAIPDPRERAVTLEWYSVGRLIRYKAAWASANFRPEEHAVLPAPYHQLLELCLDSNEIDLTAEALANQAEMQSGSGEPELATKTYQRAIELAERAGNWLKAAQVANRAADFPRLRGASDRVRFEFATRAVEAAKRANSSLELAKALRVSARTEEEMQQAVAAAVRHTELTGDREQEVQSLDRLTAMHLTSGDYQAAIDTSLRLAERSRGMRPPFDQRERAAYETIARTYSAIGEPLLARAATDRVRAFLDTTITEANRRAAAPDLWRTYEQLGRMAADGGEPAAAMEYWDTALKKIAEAAPTNSAQLAGRSILQERATLYAQLGDFEASLQDWDDVLPLLAPTFRNYSMSEASQKATWVASVAWTHALAGNYDKALALARDAIAELKRHTSGQWAQQLFAGQSANDRILEILLLTNHPDEAVAFCNFLYEKHRQESVSSVFWTAVHERELLVDLARSHLKAGQLERARSLLASAVDISRTLPAADPGWAGLGGWPELALGTLELGAGNYADAKRHLAAARAAVNPYDAERIWQIERALGLALARTGDEAGAEAHYEQALTALESIRERPRPEESRLRYGFDRSRVYEEYAGLLAAKAASSGLHADAEAAFQAAERKRAQTLWGLLATGWSRMAPEALPDQVRRSLELEVRLAAKQGILRGEFDQPPDKRNSILIEKLRGDVKQLQDDHGQHRAGPVPLRRAHAPRRRSCRTRPGGARAIVRPARVPGDGRTQLRVRGVAGRRQGRAPDHRPREPAPAGPAPPRAVPSTARRRGRSHPPHLRHPRGACAVPGNLRAHSVRARFRLRHPHRPGRCPACRAVRGARGAGAAGRAAEPGGSCPVCRRGVPGAPLRDQLLDLVCSTAVRRPLRCGRSGPQRPLRDGESGGRAGRACAHRGRSAEVATAFGPLRRVLCADPRNRSRGHADRAVFRQGHRDRHHGRPGDRSRLQVTGRPARHRPFRHARRGLGRAAALLDDDPGAGQDGWRRWVPAGV